MNKIIFTWFCKEIFNSHEKYLHNLEWIAISFLRLAKNMV